MKAIGYARVSREEQAKNGSISLDAQASKIRAACEYKGFELLDIVEDPGATGANGNRPGFQSVLERLRAGEAGAVVVFKLDRLTRSLRDLCNLFGEGGELQKRGVSFISASEEFDTGTPAGQLMMNMLGTMAEFERATISERQKVAYQYRKDELGEYRGAVPYGWRVPEGGSHKLPETWEQDDAAQCAIQWMQEVRADGLTFQAIAQALNASGRPAPRGGHWRPGTVHRVLERATSAQEARGETSVAKTPK